MLNKLKPRFKDWGHYWKVTTSGKEDELFNPYMDKLLVEGLEKGIAPQEEHVMLGGSWSRVMQNRDITQLNMIWMDNIDCTDVEDLTKAEITGRRNALYLIDIMKVQIPGFENAKLRSFAFSLGLRESRILDGQYRLTSEDVMNEAKFDDTIAIFPEFLDGYGYLILPLTGRYYHLPYRMLVPKKIDNLLVAGRAVSSDKIANVSVRNMPCCCATGQGAGVAAAISIKDNVSTANVDIKKVQEALIKQNVRIK